MEREESTKLTSNYPILLTDFHTSQVKENIVVADCKASERELWQRIYG